MDTMKAFGLPAQYCIIPTDSDRDTPNKLFLGGVPFQATEKELEEFFSQFGTVKDVRIVTDRITAECKGYGFVTFDENENIDDLLEKKAVRMKGKKIRIRRAIRRNGSQFDYLKSNQGVPQDNVAGMSLLKAAPQPVNLGSTIFTPPPSPDAPFIDAFAPPPATNEQIPHVMLSPVAQLNMNEMFTQQHVNYQASGLNTPVYHSPNPIMYYPWSHQSNTYNPHFPVNPYPR